jgi:hypothetical protein
MAEDDRVFVTPIVIIGVGAGSIFFSDSYVWHDDFPSVYIALRVRRPVAVINAVNVPPHTISSRNVFVNLH